MTRMLNELVGLPPATPAGELGYAAERCYRNLFDGAAQGDAGAQEKLVELRIAHLNWVYANTRSEASPATKEA